MLVERKVIIPSVACGLTGETCEKTQRKGRCEPYRTGFGCGHACIPKKIIETTVVPDTEPSRKIERNYI